MRFLVDQDVYAATTRLLRALGHDVATASQLGLSRADDEFLLNTAHEGGRIFVTRDRDYGALVFVRQFSGGVVYLRMTPRSMSLVHAELKRALELHDEKELGESFAVIEPGRHRVRGIHRP